MKPAVVVHGDCLHLHRCIRSGSADLLYLDPPFAVGQRFGARTQRRERRALGHSDSGPTAYDDRWPSLGEYLNWLEERLRVLWPLLSPAGTLWLHLDYRATHDAKVVCDRLFGRECFRGEVIWVPGNGAKARGRLGVTHQTLLLYAPGAEPIWNQDDPLLREAYSGTSLAMHFKRLDEQGRRYRERIVSGRTYRYYADAGKALGSVWLDCPSMVANTPLNCEATGYPTQKPLTLMKRIVSACTRPGSLVIDPFCGSGSMLDAAAALGRNAIGCDVGALAVRTTIRRLKHAGILVERVALSEDKGVASNESIQGEPLYERASESDGMEPLFIKPGLVIDSADMEWSATRASGPGGQNVNKVSSKVELRFDVDACKVLNEGTKARLRVLTRNRMDSGGRVLIVSQLTRDQTRNLEDARQKLKALLLQALSPPPVRRPTRPSRAARARRVESKQRQSAKKQQRRTPRSDI